MAIHPEIPWAIPAKGIVMTSRNVSVDIARVATPMSRVYIATLVINQKLLEFKLFL